MYRQGIEVKKDVNIGVVIEKSSWFSIIEKLYQNSERIYYPNDQDEVLCIKENNIDIAFIAGQGASMAACMTERLRIYGAKIIIRIGTCGALSKNINLWNPIITTACYSDEGTSRHYLPSGFPIISDTNINNLLADNFTNKGINYQQGITVTTDGRWKEDVELLKLLSRMGVVSIEMETAAILSVCQFRNLPAAAINIPTDLPADEENDNDFKGISDRLNYNNNLEESLNLIIPPVVNSISSYYKNIFKK